MPWLINDGAPIAFSAAGCLTTANDYGYVTLAPTGSWIAGLRPPTLTVDGSLADYLTLTVDSFISVLDASSAVIGHLVTYGVDAPYIIPLVFAGADIQSIVISGAPYTPFELCTLVLDCPPSA